MTAVGQAQPAFVRPRRGGGVVSTAWAPSAPSATRPRLAVIIIGGMIAALFLSSGTAFGEAYNTPESRQELVNLVDACRP